MLFLNRKSIDSSRHLSKPIGIQLPSLEELILYFLLTDDVHVVNRITHLFVTIRIDITTVCLIISTFITHSSRQKIQIIFFNFIVYESNLYRQSEVLVVKNIEMSIQRALGTMTSLN